MALPTDPLAAIADGLSRARTVETTDPTAMSLATADGAGRPSVRMVLLKGVEAGALLFFTNYQSRKARELADNPRAAVCIHWAKLAEQVRAEGEVERCSEAESDAYFATRPRGSQIAAWASDQSQRIASREALLARAAEVEARYANVQVPRPPFWGGYRLIPDRIELWWSRADRLHDRALYTRATDGGWTVTLLMP
jgi:pyridoxamine 5'-phosphate oxidase